MPATDMQSALSKKSQAQTSWWTIVKQTVTEWLDDDAMTWGAALACYTLLALAPLLVIALRVLAVFVGGQRASEGVQSGVGNMMSGGKAGDAVKQIMDKAASQSHGGHIAIIIGAVLAIISAGGVFAELQQAMNRIWKVKPKAGNALWAFIQSRLLSVVVLAIAAVLLVGSVIVAGWLTKRTSSMGMGWAALSWVINLLVSLGVLTLLFALLYRTVPDAEIEWRSTWFGSFISAILFEAGKYGLTAYFKYASPSSAYGAVGSLAAVLIWIYYSSLIVFFGAEFTQVYTKVRGHPLRPSKHAQFLSECDETETATPSREDPQRKPPRPDGSKQAPSQYGQVLAPHARAYRSSAAHSGAGEARRLQQQMLLRNYLSAGAGLAVGAIIGGYGILQSRRAPNPRTRDVAAARLKRRARRVEEKIDHASRMKSFLEQEDANARLDLVRERIREANRKPTLRSAPPAKPKWVAQAARLVRAYL
jgi:membrane protein